MSGPNYNFVENYEETPGNSTAGFKNTSKRLNSSPIASELLNYGTYSGADIEVIVHLPYSAELKARNIAKINEEINFAQKAYESATGSRTIALAKRELDYLIAQKQKMDDRGYGATTLTLGNLQTFSYSVFREKTPLRTLGSVYPRGIVRGTRTIAGTMIFTIFHKHILYEILDMALSYYSTGNMDKDIYIDSTMMIDQLPPLDISLRFANEYGSISHMGFWGVQFLQEGGTFSIEDLFSESTVQYIALDMDPLRVVAQRELDDSGVIEDWKMLPASQLAREDAHILRRNPFI